ncbi:MAG: hypothetical protein RSE36_03710, partial [Oscillospiraceae bacterium]
IAFSDYKNHRIKAISSAFADSKKGQACLKMQLLSSQATSISSTALRVEPGNYLICNRDISSQRQADALVCK